MSTVVGPSRTHLTSRTAAVRQITVFLLVTAALVTISTVVAVGQDVDVRRIEDATALGQAAMYLQALFPLAGAVVARLATGASPRGAGWGFRRTPWSTLATAWAYGLAIGLGGGLLVWVTGAGGFDSDGLGATVLAGLTVLPLPYVLLALGEDVGWRGLLVTRLAEHWGPRVVVLGSGLAWSAFHWPLIIWLGGTPDGVPVWFALLMFTLGTTALGAILAGLQLRWGIWPGVLVHAVQNATLYHVVEPLTAERAHTDWFGTETGVFAVVAVGVAAAVAWRRRPLVRTSDGGTRVPG